jgi:hypothetical protein
MTNSRKGEVLPPLFLDKKSEEDIYKLSPRTIKLAGKRFETTALTNHQFKLLMSGIINHLSKLSEKDIEQYIDDNQRHLLYSELCSYPENGLASNIELIIMSCIDDNIKSMMNELIKIESELDLLNSYDKIKSQRPISNILQKAISVFKKSELQKAREKHIQIQRDINSEITPYLSSASYLEWNAAFNIIIEQNDIIEKAFNVVKKKMNFAGLTVPQQ